MPSPENRLETHTHTHTHTERERESIDIIVQGRLGDGVSGRLIKEGGVTELIMCCNQIVSVVCVCVCGWVGVDVNLMYCKKGAVGEVRGEGEDEE